MPARNLKSLVPVLEQLALVKINDKVLKRVQDTVELGHRLKALDTTGIKPLYTVLEGIPMRFRDDTVEKTSRKDILSNATLTVEDYFVVPSSEKAAPQEASDTKPPGSDSKH
ncbi:Glutamyl-tRNA(Gln) amidotransferase subunit C, mitochondrial [Halotydeus destructor]|nr:Glutamyl-tRNA(Gln) amidotransferase subunit C, mitochondrial [Halotydeus destructor]